MAEPRCIPHFRSKRFATKVVDKLSAEQLQKYGITNDASRNDAIKAIQALAERYLNAEPNQGKKDQMEQNIDGFISDLDKHFSVVKVSEDNFEKAEQQYKEFGKFCVEWKTGRLGNFEFQNTKEEQEDAAAVEAILLEYADVVTYMVEKHPNNKIKSISFILLEPQKSDAKTAQQKTLDTIASIQAIESRYVRPVKDEKGKKTGRSIYNYNGKNILVESVSLNVNGEQDEEKFPVLASKIGTHVDTVGRLAFDKKSKLWENGELVDDGKLQDIIDTDLRGIFTVSGLKNLIKDFQKLEKQLREKWGDDIQIFSGDLKLFAKQPDSDLWIHGKPDLLVIDKSGTVHVLDFKTSKINDIKGYQQVLHDKYGTADKYGKQVSRYIRLLESYGLKVDNDPYIILIDTWYDSSDTLKSRKEGNEAIYDIQDTSIELKESGQTLGDYSETIGFPTREDILTPKEGDERTILYMEPRLHVGFEEGKGFTEELAALRGKEDIPFDSEVSYEQQWAALSDEEKQELQWLFNAKPVVVKTAQGIITLSKDDIESNPELISSQEIQDVAEFVMYRVSRIITDLQKGVGYDAIPDSMANEEGPSTVYSGKSRQEIVKLIGVAAKKDGKSVPDNDLVALGLQKLIDIAFENIQNRYNENFPTEQQYKEEDYDDLEFDFEDDADYESQRNMNDKAKWLIDHKAQLIRMGNSKLIALENFVAPKKVKSEQEEKQEFNSKTPNTVVTSEDMEARGETGDDESTQSFIDLYLEGITDIEAWMMGQRNYSPKASLAQEIKRMFEDIDMKDAKGNKVKDPYGWGFSMALDATMAIQTIFDTCKNCETMDEMMTALKSAARNPQNSWINQVIDTINMKGNENLKKKFFRHFRKDALSYSIAQAKFDKKTGKRIIETKIINRKSAYDTIKQSLGASFRNGSVGVYTIDGVEFSLISRDNNGANILTEYGHGKRKTKVAETIIDDIKKWENVITDLYSEAVLKKGDQTLAEYIGDQIQKRKFKVKGSNEEKTIVEAITNILNGIGIRVPQDVILNTCLQKIAKKRASSNAGTLLRLAKATLTQQLENKEGDFSAFNKKTGFRTYNKILLMISDSVQEFVEASVYQDGKTYYSYTNPSRIGHIIRNMQDALGDSEKFEKYIQDNFGRYNGWFKSVDGSEWLCDWVRQFAASDKSEARQALAHKVELSYIGNQYKNLGALGFQLSILHNYFGSKDDNSTNKDYRWFALPTMSNKPTNEFIRMLKYKNPDEIIDRVLMNTFKQEMNRIADVLFHFANYDDRVATDQIDLTEKKLRKAGWTQGEIKSLIDRINSQSITANDLVRLQKVTSGAKFHFLWYLNSEIANNPLLKEELTERVNLLLTPEGDQKQSRFKNYDEAGTLELVRETIAAKMEDIVESELDHMKKIGLFDTEIKKIGGKDVKILKYQEEFDGRLGSGENGYDNAVKEMEKALRDFIWQDIAANINIIQITGGDLAYYGNAVNYQKRIAQIHSPGLKIMHDEEYDDGYLRSVHISDEMVRGEIRSNTEVILNEYIEKAGLTGTAKEDYKKMISIILSGLTEVEATDGQSYSSPTSIRKKLALQGEWDEDKEKAYQAICKGDFNINHLGIMLQPSKPFVTSDMAKYSGSTTMELRKTPLQDKNSEYLIILAEALARGSGKRSKLVAICDFMEDTAYDKITKDENGNKIRTGYNRKGVDTVHFASVNKVGKSGVIDISEFDKEFDKKLQNKEVSEEDYNDLLTEYLLYHVRSKNNGRQSLQSQEDYDANERLVKEGKLKREETYYNSQYVDTIPVEDYIIQQEVPAHLLEHQQLYGSQMRILGISDITPGTEFTVNGDSISAEALVQEYKDLHATNIRESFNDLMTELGLDKLNKNGEVRLETIDELPSDERNQVYKNLETLLQKELTKDAKYGSDMYRACTLQYNTTTGNVIDFAVPLMDPIQSRRIQELINSIIKKSINKQRITGGPVVQTTAYDRNLHIRFKDKQGNILPTLEEYGGDVEAYKKYLKKNQAGIAYFECYMPIPNATIERLMTNPDGSMMSFEELKQKLPKDVFDSMMQVIGYRIPTEDKYSMLPLKIMGFVPKAAGQVIMMPQEITYLTGSDFDIDKMYIMMKAFNIKAPEVKKEDKAGHWKKLAKEYFNETGKRWNTDWEQTINDIVRIGNDILYGNEKAWRRENITLTENTKWEDVVDFIVWYRNKLITEAFEEFTNQQDEKKFNAKKARDNRILDLQWAVLTNEDTASKMLNPGNFNDQKKVGRIIRLLKDNAADPETGEVYTYEYLNSLDINELDGLLENAEQHNTTLPSSKIYFQRQNMQGTQMVGIFANHNVSHAFMTFQKVGINLQKNPLYDNTFSFEGILIGDEDNPTILDPQKGFNGQLISKTIASFLAASVDTAKDPVLSDLNVNTFTGGVAMVLARLGFDTASIGLFLSQPVIMQLSELYFKNSTDGFYKGDTAIKELASMLGIKEKDLKNTDNLKDNRNEYAMNKTNFVEHLNDTDYDEDDNNYQKEVLKCFYRLYQIAHDLGELTFCTKFNSVSNAVGPTIADTMEDIDRVEKFIEDCETNVFYVPESDEDPMGFTNPKDIISNDPILRAFFDYTAADKRGKKSSDNDGASTLIFRNFFPHYYPGFQNVRQYFKDNFLGGKKLNSKLYNQLLNEYLYYIMTYQDEKFSPTVPYSEQDKRRLVNNLVTDFQEVLKIEGRRPNMILDQGLGNNCLRVRSADEFLAVDTLIFNTSQLNADGQQKIKNAWSDLITMNDPNLSEEDNERIKGFGVDLFFYNLMRNGFTFSPKTMMTLASVVVRYNATYANGFQNYIIGLRKLKDVDEFLMGRANSLDNIKRFCAQFIRNHANNGQLIPKIDIFDKKFDASIDTKTNEIILSAPEGKETNLAKIIPIEGKPYPFITVITKSGKTMTQELYELVETIGGDKVSTDGKGGISVRYKKSNRLGLTNNFIEYDANSDIETSFFEDIRNESIDDMDAETPTEGQAKDDQDQISGTTSPETTFTGYWNSEIMPIIKTLKGPQAGKEGKDYRLKLKKALEKTRKNTNSELAQTFNEMLKAKQEERQSLMDKINKIFKEENKC